MFEMKRQVNKRLMKRLAQVVIGIEDSPALADIVLAEARESLQNYGAYVVPEYLSDGLPVQARYVEDSTIDTFLGLKEAAKFLGVKSPKTARRRLPEPDATIGRAVGWRLSTIVAAIR